MKVQISLYEGLIFKRHIASLGADYVLCSPRVESSLAITYYATSPKQVKGTVLRLLLQSYHCETVKWTARRCDFRITCEFADAKCDSYCRRMLFPAYTSIRSVYQLRLQLCVSMLDPRLAFRILRKVICHESARCALDNYLHVCRN